MNRKKILFNCVLFFLLAGLFSQMNLNEESKKNYRLALESFENKNYGDALKYSEFAILYRRQLIEKQIESLKTSLTSRQVQTAGDEIDSILEILIERKENVSVEIIDYYLKRKGIEYFDNSMQKLLTYLQESLLFPEAQKLIGDIYRLEGEYDFAETYYLLALENASVLDIPDQKYEILYLLAEISRLKKDYNKMEVRLLNLLVEDKNFRDKNLISSMKRTIKSSKKGTMEKFFTLYRADSYIFIDAYNQLAEFYYKNQELSKALEFACLSAITSFSKISEILEERNIDYEYSTFSKFLQEASFYDDVVEWGKKSSAWKSFNILAKYAKENECQTFARELLVSLAQFSPVLYWQKDAVLLLEEM